ncbi:hypothetical protein IGI04_005602 [Brassica rapa subsp. trilocularis]|uniref:C2H2-type domain-containing protein n=2 Tax=Brassica TaxID=3705 RepID=A0ABQ8E7U2_BRANA|nr:uncharacterized protein LOC103851971 [Brassica rapa]XP_013704786.3 uncharacterized protein LOC106408591 [Brassica napus]KAG5409283.1 hypothetical protein IGI04_005602 [Brassica rapa subsp. trilocularis]KAH0937695.1 hypothetical protein HID58_005156 [Brassica napus]
MMNNNNIVHICDTCRRQFPTLKALYGHQRVHTRERELERQLKRTKPSYPPGQGTSYGFSPGTPLVTHNHNHPTFSNFNRPGISFGPFKSGGGGNSRGYPLFNHGNTMAPPANPYRSLTQNTSYGSSSRVPLPSFRYNNSLGSANSIGRFSNNNSSQGELSLELSLGPSKSMGDSNSNSSSQGSLSLELSLGPSKSMSGNNNNSSAYASLNCGVTGGGNMYTNMPVRPRVPGYHFYRNNPIDSITRNVPLSHPPPTTNTMNRLVRPRASRFHFHGHNPLDSIIRNVPLSQPPPTINIPDDNNVSGTSLIVKEKDKTVVLDDDEKDDVVIVDHDEDQQEEVEAKSCGRDSIIRNVPLSQPPPTTNMNKLVRPRASRFHFHGHNPLDSIIQNVPLSQPHPTTNIPDDNNVSGTSLIVKEKDTTVVLDDDEKDNVVIVDHDEGQQEEVEAKSCGRGSIISNVPLSQPPSTTNPPDDNNVSGSSLIANEKDKTVVLEDDEKDNVVIVDHGEDQQEEVEAKSCGRDSFISNVPLSQPPSTTNLPDDNNVSGSSLITKEKDKTVVLDDDETDNVGILDHDEDQQEEVEAKSCGRD